MFQKMDATFAPFPTRRTTGHPGHRVLAGEGYEACFPTQGERGKEEEKEKRNAHMHETSFKTTRVAPAVGAASDHTHHLPPTPHTHTHTHTHTQPTLRPPAAPAPPPPPPGPRRASSRLAAAPPRSLSFDVIAALRGASSRLPRELVWLAGGGSTATWSEAVAARRCDSATRGVIYDAVAGVTCHFCRQKKLCGEPGCGRCEDRDPDQPCAGKSGQPRHLIQSVALIRPPAVNARVVKCFVNRPVTRNLAVVRPLAIGCATAWQRRGGAGVFDCAGQLAAFDDGV